MASAAPPPAPVWAQRVRAATAIETRTRAALFGGAGIYITMTIALLAASIVLNNTVRFVERNAVLSTRQPLFLPLMFFVVLFSVVLALAAALAVARERDRGTLRVLLFAPVDEAAFIAGHFVAQIKVYASMALLALVWANLATFALNLSFSPHVIVALAASVLTVGAVVAFSLLVAVWGGRARTTTTYFVLIALAFIGLQAGSEAVGTIALARSLTQNDPIYVIRDALVTVNGVAQWVSPYAQFSQTLDALLSGDLAGVGLHVGVTVVQAAGFFLASVGLLRRKGAG